MPTTVFVPLLVAAVGALVSVGIAWASAWRSRREGETNRVRSDAERAHWTGQLAEQRAHAERLQKEQQAHSERLQREQQERAARLAAENHAHTERLVEQLARAMLAPERARQKREAYAGVLEAAHSYAAAPLVVERARVLLAALDAATTLASEEVRRALNPLRDRAGYTVAAYQPGMAGTSHVLNPYASSVLNAAAALPGRVEALRLAIERDTLGTGTPLPPIPLPPATPGPDTLDPPPGTGPYPPADNGGAHSPL